MTKNSTTQRVALYVCLVALLIAYIVTLIQRFLNKQHLYHDNTRRAAYFAYGERNSGMRVMLALCAVLTVYLLTLVWIPTLGMLWFSATDVPQDSS